MEQSVAVDPSRLVHRLDLARVYAARGNTAKAREQYELDRARRAHGVQRSPLPGRGDRGAQVAAVDGERSCGDAVIGTAIGTLEAASRRPHPLPHRPRLASVRHRLALELLLQRLAGRSPGSAPPDGPRRRPSSSRSSSHASWLRRPVVRVNRRARDGARHASPLRSAGPRAVPRRRPSASRWPGRRRRWRPAASRSRDRPRPPRSTARRARRSAADAAERDRPGGCGRGGVAASGRAASARGGSCVGHGRNGGGR